MLPQESDWRGLPLTVRRRLPQAIHPPLASVFLQCGWLVYTPGYGLLVPLDQDVLHLLIASGSQRRPSSVANAFGRCWAEKRVVVGQRQAGVQIRLAVGTETGPEQWDFVETRGGPLE